MELKKIMLSLSVGLLAALFIGFLIEAIYPNPIYEDYCNQFEFSSPKIMKQELCNFTYDFDFRNKCVNEKGMIQEDYNPNGCIIKETCNYCSKSFMDATEKYNRNLFYITAPIGLLLIILGLYLPSTLDAIAGGLLFGGILTMLQITMRVFGNLGKWTRVILLGLELILVIWIGIKKVKK